MREQHCEENLASPSLGLSLPRVIHASFSAAEGLDFQIVVAVKRRLRGEKENSISRSMRTRSRSRKTPMRMNAFSYLHSHYC